MAGNVHKIGIKKITIPAPALVEDRGLKLCGEPLLKLADPSDSTPWKNDVTGVFERCDTLEVFVEKPNGDEELAKGEPVTFPKDPEVKGFIINWREYYDGGGNLEGGCYKVLLKCVREGVEFEYYWQTVNLLPYRNDTSEGTTRIFSFFNDFSEEYQVNFNASGFQDSIRFRGFFGYQQPNYTIENNIYTNDREEKIRNFADRKYFLHVDPSLRCVSTQVEKLHLLNATEMFISDYNATNHDLYRDFPVILSKDDSPENNYNEGLGTPYMQMIAVFKKKTNKSQSYYSGDIMGENIPVIPLWVGVTGGGCEPATATIINSEGTNLESKNIPSGGSDTLLAPDGVANIKKSDDVLISALAVPSATTKGYNVADSVITLKDTGGTTLEIKNVKATDPAELIAGNSIITVNSEPFKTLLSTENIDIITKDDTDSVVVPLSVVSPEIVFNDQLSLAKSFKEAVILDGGFFESEYELLIELRNLAI